MVRIKSEFGGRRLVYVIIEIICLLVGLYEVFNGDKSWRWIGAAIVILTTINMLR